MSDPLHDRPKLVLLWETPTGRRVGVASVRHDTLVYTYEENDHESAVFIVLTLLHLELTDFL
jgi:hypothetical protein